MIILKTFSDRFDIKYRVTKQIVNSSNLYRLERFGGLFWSEVYYNIDLKDVLWHSNEYNASEVFEV